MNTPCVTDVIIALVVPVVLDRLRGQNVIQVAGIGLLFNPFTDSGKHIAVDFDTFISQPRMVEDTKNIGHYLVDRNARVLPRIENTSKSY